MKATYFSHDENARNDPKMIRLRMKYGIEGYGCFFALLEMFSEVPEHALQYDEEQFEAISYDLRTNIVVQDFIDRCIELELFQCDGSRFWSESFNRRLAESAERSNSRSSAASKAAAARWGKRKKQCDSNAHAMQTHCDNNAEAFSVDGLDPDWVRFVQVYEQNLGLIPYGASLDKLTSYYEDMGADVLIEAVKATNLAQANNPMSYMCAILDNWAKAGVDSLEKAKAAVIDHERRNRAKQEQKGSAPEPAAIRGKFY